MKIGITVGDPLGIGPEIVKEALSLLSDKERAKVVVYRPAFCHREKTAGQPQPSGGQRRSNPEVGVFDETEAAHFAKESLDMAIDDALNKKIGAIVTAPVNKARMRLVIPDFSGHTEYLAKRCSIENPTMIFASLNKNTFPPIALVTTHTAIKNLSSIISKEKILNTILNTHKFFDKSSPKIAVLSLNPHAGEMGTIGDEETEQIRPAIDEAIHLGINCSGPFSSDSFFGRREFKNFNAIVAMYHDQALIPAKLLEMDDLVNITVGLPFIRTSPPHGTAEDIVGTKKPDPTGMLNAIKMALLL